MKTLFSHAFIFLLLAHCSIAFSQEDELSNNGVYEEEIRYKSLLDYEIDFNESERFLTTEQRYYCHNTLASYFKLKYDYSRALLHALEALKCAQDLDDTYNQGISQLQVSSIHLDIQHGDEAIDAANAAIEIFTELQDTSHLIDAYNSMANSHLMTGQLVKGLKWYNKSLDLCKELEDDEMAMIPISNIGAYYLFRGEADSAMSYIDKALSFERYSRDRENMAMAYGNKAYAYTLKEDYQMAKVYFDSSFTIAIEENLKVVLLNLYKDRSDMYYALGDFKQSYKDLVAFQRINDSLKNSVSSKQISDWKVAYANEEKKRELITEKAKYNELKHIQELDSFKTWFTITVLSLTLIIISILFWRYRTKSKKDKELQRLSEELAKKS